MISSEGFNGREEKLREIIRFNMKRFTPMFYRTNLFFHAQRVYLLVEDMLPSVLPVYDGELDPEKALTLTLVHDDAEIITGDVQLYHKDRMTPEELAKIDEQEAEAIEELARSWPQEINGFSYKGLLYHALKKDCLEAQVVSYADKVDAFCECLHELHAGNKLFIGPAINYIKIIKAFPDKFPSLAKMLPTKHPLLVLPDELDIGEIVENGGIHSQESIGRKTGLPYYDRWKELTIRYIGVEPLITIKENN